MKLIKLIKLNLQNYLFRLRKDRLLANSVCLMTSTFVLAFFGFIFWIVNARLFDTEQIGIATTLVSITTLITTISMFGFNAGIVRYLPGFQNKNQLVNTSLSISGILSLIISIIFLISISFFSPRLIFLKNNYYFLIFFPLFMFLATLNTLTDSIFIALRSTKYVLLINFMLGIVKIISPLVFISISGFPTFASIMFSISLAAIISLVILKRKFELNYSFNIKLSVITKIIKYSFGNYIGGVFGMLSTSLLPLIITNYLTPQETAYYYMPSMVIALLLSIPRSISSSLLAEGSHDKLGIQRKVYKALLFGYLLLIPAVLLLFLFGQHILLVFGKEYSTQGIVFLKLCGLMTLFVLPNTLLSTILNIRENVRGVIFLNLINAVSTIITVWLLIDYRLVGIGIALISTQVVTFFSVLVLFFRFELFYYLGMLKKPPLTSKFLKKY